MGAMVWGGKKPAETRFEENSKKKNVQRLETVELEKAVLTTAERKGPIAIKFKGPRRFPTLHTTLENGKAYARP